jgi:hypothetical protein
MSSLRDLHAPSCMLFSERVNMQAAIHFREPAGIRVTDAEPVRINSEPELSVFVVFTSIDWQLKALEKAQDVARSLGSGIAVIALQVVPFPLPLDRPPVPIAFAARRLEEKSSEISGRAKITVYLCRDPLEALQRILNPKCPVVMGIRKKWWPTRDERLARKLRRAGYEIILVDKE